MFQSNSVVARGKCLHTNLQWYQTFQMATRTFWCVSNSLDQWSIVYIETAIIQSQGT